MGTCCQVLFFHNFATQENSKKVKQIAVNATVPYLHLDNNNLKYIPSTGRKDESKLHLGV